MEHGLKYITSYVQQHIAPLAMCYNPPLGGGRVGFVEAHGFQCTGTYSSA